MHNTGPLYPLKYIFLYNNEMFYLGLLVQEVVYPGLDGRDVDVLYPCKSSDMQLALIQLSKCWLKRDASNFIQFL